MISYFFFFFFFFNPRHTSALPMPLNIRYCTLYFVQRCDASVVMEFRILFLFFVALLLQVNVVSYLKVRGSLQWH